MEIKHNFQLNSIQILISQLLTLVTYKKLFIYQSIGLSPCPPPPPPPHPIRYLVRIYNYRLCLVHIWLAIHGLRSPYPPFRAASARPPCGGRRWLWDFRTDSRAPRPLRFGLARSFTNLKKNRKTVACRHVILKWHCTIPARASCEGRSPYGLRTISVLRMRRLHGNCTDIAWFPYNLRTVSVRIYPGLPPRPRRRNRTMLVDNVNTYAVAHSHLRCPKTRTENRR